MTTDTLDPDVEFVPDELAKYVAEQRWATTQSRAWLKRRAMASYAISLHQEGLPLDDREWYEPPSAFEEPSWYVTVPTDELAGMELDYGDLVTLVRCSLGFDFPKADPGLRGNKPKLWEPTSVLGHTLKDMAVRFPFRPATQLAEESR